MFDLCIIFVNVQDYGPKVNFKKKKVQLGRFDGLPSFIESLVSRMTSQVEALAHFVPVELCCLDYSPERGAAIDPHMDDSWLWGEQLVTLNLISSTTLTFSTPTQSSTTNANHTSSNSDHTSLSTPMPVAIQVFLPRRSVVLVEGNARHHWEHSIQRSHVTSRRVAVTIRELTREFLPGGESYETIGKSILETAASYSGHPTNLHRTIIPK